jgi:phage-related protein
LVQIKRPVLRPLFWMGNSRKNIREFPEPVRKDFGDEIQLMQFGGMPPNAKPFKGVGSGVFEIPLRHETNAYRTVLAVQLGEAIYVLHAFQKKSPKGIKTPKPDIELIKQRYKEAREHAHYDKKQKDGH